jgi:hypothetical protein
MLPAGINWELLSLLSKVLHAIVACALNNFPFIFGLNERD